MFSYLYLTGALNPLWMVPNGFFLLLLGDSSLNPAIGFPFILWFLPTSLMAVGFFLKACGSLSELPESRWLS